jgi:hypothetical protein
MHGSLEVSGHMLHCSPMTRARKGVVLAESSHCIGNIWTSASGQIHEASYSTEIWNGSHVRLLLSSLAAHVLGELTAWIQGHGGRSAVCHVELGKGILSVLVLAEVQGVLRPIPFNLQTVMSFLVETHAEESLAGEVEEALSSPAYMKADSALATGE